MNTSTIPHPNNRGLTKSYLKGKLCYFVSQFGPTWPLEAIADVLEAISKIRLYCPAEDEHLLCESARLLRIFVDKRRASWTQNASSSS